VLVALGKKNKKYRRPKKKLSKTKTTVIYASLKNDQIAIL